jgi:phytoene dehydrogenase-like protein
MSAAELLEEWSEAPLLRGTLAALAVTGSLQGPYGGGTAYGLLHQMTRGEDPACGVTLVRGGIARLPEILAEIARRHGADIRLSAEVRAIVPGRRGLDVTLAGGEAIRTETVISTLDPRRTLADLSNQDLIEPGVAKQVLQFGLQGVVAKVHLALAQLPDFTGLDRQTEYLRGAISVAPSLEYVERAYDDAKYGGVSRHPFFEVVVPTLTDPSLAPPGRHVMSVLVQYVPYRLAREPHRDSLAGPQVAEKAEGDPSGTTWTEARGEALGDLVVQRLADYAPRLPELILAREVLTPADLEGELGLTAGDIFQGQLRLDQLWFMRPIPGWSRYRTPIPGLYLGGAGAHPGGGVMGTAGYLAARTVLRDLRRRRT